MPPSRAQVRLASVIAVLLLIGCIAALPFINVRLATVTAFIPVVDTILFLGDVITAALLYSQFSVVRSRGLLVLASGYLYTGFIIVPHGLTFPDAFTHTGLLGANLQSTVWLYIFWHVGLPPAVIGYAWFTRFGPTTPLAPGSIRPAIVGSITAVAVLVISLTWLVTAGADVLPRIMVDAMHANVGWHYAAPVLILMSVIAVGLLWTGRRSVLDLWLLVVLWAWLIETILLSTTLYRYSLVWYAGRLYGVLSASFVLLALLAESTLLYARLAISVMAQGRERENRLMTMDAVAASIAHEINQPLAAIVANGSAGLRWLAKSPPDLVETRAVLERIGRDGRRAGDVIESVRSIFKRDHDEKWLAVDINQLIEESITMLRADLHTHQVVVQLELTAGLPHVVGHKGQLQQVILNIISNAADAMNSVTGRTRLVRIVSTVQKANTVLVSVEDSGIGIEPQHVSRLFDPFFSTKSKGMGMGLAICRSIVESHGGSLWMSPGNSYGSIFHVALPAAGSLATR